MKTPPGQIKNDAWLNDAIVEQKIGKVKQSLTVLKQKIAISKQRN
jgi:hypothetical protein